MATRRIDPARLIEAAEVAAVSRRLLAARMQRIALDLKYTRIEYGEPNDPGHTVILIRLPVTPGKVAAIAAQLFELAEIEGASERPPIFSIKDAKIVRKRVRKSSNQG